MDTTRALSENPEYNDPFGPSEDPENQSAFPITVCENGAIISEGISKREYFAGLAMQGLLSGQLIMEVISYSPEELAKTALQYTDALLAELSKP